MEPPNLLVLQNAPWEGPGLIAEYASASGVKLTIAEMFAKKPVIPFEKLERGAFAAAVGLGSPSTAYRPETNPNHREMVELFRLTRRLKVPSFNICYSMQLFAVAHGGRVIKNPAGKEVGLFEVVPTSEGERDPVLAGIGRHVTLEWHGDIVERLPPGADLLASSKMTKNQVAVLDRIHYMVQGDGQAATPSMVRSWMRRDSKWALEGTGLDKSRLLRAIARNEAYLRNTYLRIFGNFLGIVLTAP